ncbi:Peptidase M13, N-terminal domain [Cinara cedri]|uniref:Peptidase M13, N-terminal domain n=1 Tax=Cinara cedri TaxID=506608 RepID=A0A5E4NAS5_9HEMI|nr:Peptidase M13, N-terminal domain [Cinara cedri]
MCGGGGRTCVRYRQRVIVNMPGYLSGLAAALASTDRRVLANYMVWRAVASCVPFTDRRLRDLQQTLHAELYGQPTRQPRWAECVDVVSAGLYLAVGRLYVTRYFDGRTKNATADMVKKIRREMHDALTDSGTAFF